jgi:pyruvate/2-oxoglutarate dehydrogenase complex dihydrolipoamide acyltransferase (E2) component
MARIPIAMPILGYDMESGRIGQWVKALGDVVSRGDVLAEIETDKATVEMESVAAGRLVEIIHDAGTDVRVGDVIGYLESDPSTS